MTRRTVACRCGLEFVTTGRRAAAVAPGGGRLDRCGQCRRRSTATREAARQKARRALRTPQCAVTTAAAPSGPLYGPGIALS